MLSARRGIWPCLFLLALVALPVQAQVVISQVYGGGGNSGAPYNRDFIELFNSGGTPVNIGGWSVHYASTTGNFTTNKTDIPAGITLQPGQYYLVGGGSGATGAALPTVDVSGAINLSGTAGKVALTNTNAQLGVSCPTGGALVDFVGFGTAANCAETGPTANLSNTTAAIRANAGCTDTGSNAADFTAATPTPRNSASTLNPCGGGGTPSLSISDFTVAEGDAGTTLATFTVSLNFPAGAGGVSFDIATADGSATTADNDYTGNSATGLAIAEGSASTTFAVTINGDTQVESTESFTVNVSNVTGATLADGQAFGTIQNDDFVVVPVHAIQGNTDVSPYAVNAIVATEGIVTARTSNGFFLQTPDAEADADAASSEGVFVFTSTAPPASAAVGNRVRVNATLDEYNPGGQLPLTELKNATVIQVSTGNALPAPIVLTDTDANSTSPIDQLERYEGMRVSIPSLKVTAPVDGNITETSAASSSNGIFYGVLPTVARPFREPGIDVLDPITIPGGLSPPLFDHNAENIRVRSTGQTGAALLSVDVGDTVNGLVGVLDYGFGSYTMTPDPGAGASIVLGSAATAVSTRAADEITIGGFNLLHFFDDVADGNGATKLTTAGYQFRLKKTANAICAYTRNPDILGVIEVEHIKALGELAASINSNNGNALFPGACSGNPGYQAYLVEGNDVGGIDVGFLLKTEDVAPGKPRVEVVSIDQIGKAALFTNADNSTELLNDRPPLVLVARINAANGASQTVTVIANHLRSLIDVNTTTVGTKGWATVGERVRAKRGAQALYLAQLIQDRQTANPDEKIVLLGDFNAFEFNDGFVDSMGIVTGREEGPTKVLRYVDSPITTPLTNTAELVHAEDRYSFSFDGNAQSLDHMVVNQAVLDSFAGVRAEHARINADFGIDNYGDATVPVRVSDHDPVVLFLRDTRFNDADVAVNFTQALTPFTAPSPFYVNFQVRNLGPNDATNVNVTLAIGVAPALVTLQAPPEWTCLAPVADGAGGSLVHCSLPSLPASGLFSFVATVDTAPIAPAVTQVAVGVAVASSETDPVPANSSADAIAYRAANYDACFTLVGTTCAFQYPTPPVVPHGTPFHAVLGVANHEGVVLPNTVVFINIPLPVAQVQLLAGQPDCEKQPSNTAQDETFIICHLGDLPAGDATFKVAFDLNLELVRTPTLQFIAMLTADPGFARVFVGALKPIQAADFGVSVHASAKAGPGLKPVTFRITGTNAGPDTQDAALLLTYTAPGAKTMPTLDFADWGYCVILDTRGGAPSSPEHGEISCSMGAFAPGDAGDMTLVFHPAFAQTGKAIEVVADILPLTLDPDQTEDPTGNNTATTTYQVPVIRFAPPSTPPPPRLD